MIEKTCKITALRILSRKSYSVAELRKKLIDREFSPEVVEATICYLAEHGFINDQLEAERRVHRLQERGFGPYQISGRLAKAGLAVERMTREEQRETIVKLLEKTAVKRKEKHKKIAFLQRRGFDLECILEVIKGTPYNM